jgi:hypothetical protein
VRLRTTQRIGLYRRLGRVHEGGPGPSAVKLVADGDHLTVGHLARLSVRGVMRGQLGRDQVRADFRVQVRELVLGIGEERTWSRLANDLGLILPKAFPSFDLSFDNALPGYVVTVAQELESDQLTALRAAFEKLQIGFPFRTTVDSTLQERAQASYAFGSGLRR